MRNFIRRKTKVPLYKMKCQKRKNKFQNQKEIANKKIQIPSSNDGSIIFEARIFGFEIWN